MGPPREFRIILSSQDPDYIYSTWGLGWGHLGRPLFSIPQFILWAPKVHIHFTWKYMHPILTSQKSQPSTGWVGQVVGHRPVHQKVEGMIPGQSIYLACRFNPKLGHMAYLGGNWLVSLSLSLSLSPFPLGFIPWSHPFYLFIYFSMKSGNLPVDK